MLRHLLKTSLRGLWKNRIYVLLNALGLGVSLACCMAAYLWVAYDLEFDDFHQDDRVASIYKVHSHWTSPDIGQNILSPYALGARASSDLSGIQKFSRYYFEKGYVQFDSHHFEEGIAFADSSFIRLFDFPIIHGSLASFGHQDYVIISRQLSERLFSDRNPIGQIVNIQLNDQEHFPVVVGAVIENIPHNSSFTFEMLLRVERFAGLRGIEDDDWSVWPAFSTFFEIEQYKQIDLIEQELLSYLKLYRGDISRLSLESFKSDHDMSEIDGAMINVRMWPTPIRVLATMALLILMIACFNLANTTYALSIRRIREMHVRKVLGADRRHIFWMFLLETSLIVFLALLIGLSLAQYIVPVFAEAWADGISNRWGKLIFGLHDVSQLNFMLFLTLTLILSAVFAGSYPAFFHGRLKTSIPQNRSKLTPGISRISQTLLVLQFSLSVLVIASATVWIGNSDYINRGDVGFDKSGLMYVKADRFEDIQAYTRSVKELPGIDKAVMTLDHIGVSLNIAEVESGIESDDVKLYSVSPDYLETVRLRLTTGRFLLSSDAFGVVVTKRLQKTLGLDEPLGSRLKLDGDYYSIVGVVEDVVDNWHIVDAFNIMPIVFKLSSERDDKGILVVRSSGESSQAILKLQDVWHQSFPSKPFIAKSQEEVLTSGHAENLKSTFILLALMTVLISITGAYALARLNIEKRLHEMAIRKVFGADLKVLFRLLNKEFALVLISASFLGCFIAYYLFRQINSSEYKVIFIEVTSRPFLFTAFGTILLGLLFSCIVIYRHAHRNPADVLRNQ